jgi:hypothetical protein
MHATRLKDSASAFVELGAVERGISTILHCCAVRCAAPGDDGGLKVQEIDAYWLQRRISTSLGGMEAAASQRLAQEVFEALQVRYLAWLPYCCLLFGSSTQCGGALDAAGEACRQQHRSGWHRRCLKLCR